jgi:hypothetical protein
MNRKFHFMSEVEKGIKAAVAGRIELTEEEEKAMRETMTSAREEYQEYLDNITFWERQLDALKTRI